MENLPAVTPPQDNRGKLVASIASKYNLAPNDFYETIKATIFKGAGSKADMIVFLVVANEYGLNPLTREIYAISNKDGGLSPVVSVDGYARIVNAHPAFNGMFFEDTVDAHGTVTAITCRIFRKDRDNPVECTEYLAECKRNTGPWNSHPRRMLRHKAFTQAARYAFGLALMDPDEAERAGFVTTGHSSEAFAQIADMTQYDEVTTPCDIEEVDDDDTVTVEHNGGGTATKVGRVLEQMKDRPIMTAQKMLDETEVSVAAADPEPNMGLLDTINWDKTCRALYDAAMPDLNQLKTVHMKLYNKKDITKDQRQSADRLYWAYQKKAMKVEEANNP